MIFGNVYRSDSLFVGSGKITSIIAVMSERFSKTFIISSSLTIDRLAVLIKLAFFFIDKKCTLLIIPLVSCNKGACKEMTFDFSNISSTEHNVTYSFFAAYG